MKREYIVSLVTVLILLACAKVYAVKILPKFNKDKTVKVGFIYNGDESEAYSNNFMLAKNRAKEQYGDAIKVYEVKNVSETRAVEALDSLVDKGCDIIFTNSAEYGDIVKEYAGDHKKVQFCQATCNNANESPKYDNYHTFMGEIYQGRYVSGVVAGMKLKSMIDDNIISEDEALIGYVAAFPYAEVISGYTSFLMGIRSVVPTATMKVIYTNTWGDYSTEKEYAEKLIDMGCVIISQHSDTIGPAVACEDSDQAVKVYHVGYNESMINVAPTTSLVSSRINWAPYITGAIGAVLDGDVIEKRVKGHVHGNDIGGGFKEDWVEMRETNDNLLPENTPKEIIKIIEKFGNHEIQVFKGKYTGVNPYDPEDKVDLTTPFHENAAASAPEFCYVLDDVVEIVEFD